MKEKEYKVYDIVSVLMLFKKSDIESVLVNLAIDSILETVVENADNADEVIFSINEENTKKLTDEMIERAKDQSNED